MYELVQLGKKTYFIDCPSRMGLYMLDEQNICLIDTGNDKDAARKIYNLLNERSWQLKMIINTHSHADHIGGNHFLQQKFDCPIYAPGIESVIAEYCLFEPVFLWGGFPPKELNNKFLLAQPSRAQKLTPDILPTGLEMLALDGHAMEMAAIKTSDNIWFVGDCLTNGAILRKYHIGFLYDVEKYLVSLAKVEQLDGELFIAAHASPTKDIKQLAKLNRNKVFEIINLLLEICGEPKTFEEILKAVFDHYGLRLEITQYALCGSTLRSYLAYLHNHNKLDFRFIDNRMYWKTVSVQKGENNG